MNESAPMKLNTYAAPLSQTIKIVAFVGFCCVLGASIPLLDMGLSPAVFGAVMLTMSAAMVAGIVWLQRRLHAKSAVVLGADGLRAGNVFVGWPRVVSVEQAKPKAGDLEYSEYRDRTWVHAVVVHREHEPPLRVRVRRQAAFILEARLRMAPDSPAGHEPTDYRSSVESRAPTGVRVAVDPSVDLAKRRNAFDGLSLDEQDVVVASLAQLGMADLLTR